MEMVERKQSYVKCSSLYEVDLKRSDSYDAVVRKISDVVGLSETDEEKVLLMCRGLVINPNLGDNNPWDIGSYLNKKHIAPEKLTLGVGLVASSDVAGSPPPLHRKNSRKRQRAPSLCPPTVKCPKQSTCNDKIQGA